MFNFQGSELIIILLLALVVLGPEKLPHAMRRLGRFYADLKKMSTGFQEEFRAVVDEPTRELRETASSLRDSLDFRKLQDGERAEKPKSAEMGVAGNGDRPGPFSGAQSISAAPSTRSDSPEPEPEPDPAPEAPRLAPQIAVDDEHGLREARPADRDETA